jgi:hypothetical protein
LTSNLKCRECIKTVSTIDVMTMIYEINECVINYSHSYYNLNIINNLIKSLCIFLSFFNLFFLFFNCLLGDLLLAKRAIIVIFKPLLDTILVKVVFFVARQRNYVIGLLELQHADRAFGERLICFRIEFCSL